MQMLAGMSDCQTDSEEGAKLQNIQNDDQADCNDEDDYQILLMVESAFKYLSRLELSSKVHSQQKDIVFRYECSTPTSQKLSSPIFQVVGLSGIGNTRPNLQFFQDNS